MDAKQIAINEAKSFVNNLLKSGIKANKTMLFGSYAKGNAGSFSDIDLAVWSSQFTGVRMIDYEKIGLVLGNHTNIEFHPFSLEDNAENNPFVAEILLSGIEL